MISDLSDILFEYWGLSIKIYDPIVLNLATDIHASQDIVDFAMF